MGVQDLQVFLESGLVVGSCINVDLVKLARDETKFHMQGPMGGPIGPKFSLVLDGECCLDRLYGGFFSDWVCGGQWNRLASFLGQFVSSLGQANIEVIVFFNGCAEQARHQEWVQAQLKIRNNINQVLRHVNNKHTPPPKVWWTPPPCLRPAIRMALRNLNVPVVVTMDDHKQEVIAYCRENKCHGIIADDAEYIAFDPPRYFSSQNLKLTYKGALESKEYMVKELAKGLELNGDQMCVLAALLGNYVLLETELVDLHRKLTSGQALKEGGENRGGRRAETSGELVQAVAGFVRSLANSARDLDKLGLEVFGTAGTERAAKLKQAVQYYLDGTESGFLNYRPNKQYTRRTKKVRPGDKQDYNDSDMEVAGKFASEAGCGNELEGLISISEATACLTVGPEIVVDETHKEDSNKSHLSEKLNGEVNGGSHLVINLNTGSSSSSGSPRLNESSSPTPSKAKTQKQVRLLVEEDKIVLPPVAPEVMRTVNERHAKGLMSPMIHQILTQGEVRLGVVLEDEHAEEVPNIQLFYRPMRQMVYAILFNLHHLVYMARTAAKEKDLKGEIRLPEVKIKEWIWSKGNPYTKPEPVKAEQLGWGVPTVQRLWFGTTVDDKRRRLRAYLTCMRSDTQLMLDSSYVPQHLLVLATVLRYIMSFTGKRVLRKYELDAIIATAMDPHLSNSEYNQELKVECVSSRSVQVGSLIMTGIEHALLVNDTCGAPIPWVVACPWLYFDGKLLHATMTRASTVKNALELCSHRVPQVMKVERMREAILEGLFVQWARPPMIPPPMSPGHVVPSGGGRLEIAGVVVGNWGPNCRLPHESVIPQVTCVGGGRGRGFPRGGSALPVRGGRQRQVQQQPPRSHQATFNRGGGAGNNESRKGRGAGRGGGGKRDKKQPLKGQGRGTTAVSPYTGATVDASDLSESFNVEESDQLEETKRRPGQRQNKSLRILSQQDHNSGLMMNGKPGVDVVDQFADASSLTADIMCMNMKGDGVDMNALMAATSIQEN